jgi:hypothetical protein
VRTLVALFGETVSVTEPSPLPVAGDIVTHASLEEADHVQPACAVTVTVVVPPDAGTDAVVVGETE